MAKRFGWSNQGARFGRTDSYAVAGSNGKILYAKKNSRLNTRDYYTSQGMLVDRRPINHHSYGDDKGIKLKTRDGKKVYIRGPITIKR